MDTKIDKNRLILGICLVTFSFFLALMLKGIFVIDFGNVELAKMDGSMRVQCGTGSMGLTFGCDDLIYYRDIEKNEQFIPGDIYIYKKDDDSKVVHRLIECVDIDCNITVFKGDNNAVGEFVNKSQIIRKVESVRYR